jgi:hypothetical protein
MKQLLTFRSATRALLTGALMIPLFMAIPSYTAAADDNGWTRVDEAFPLDLVQVNGCAGNDVVVLSGQATVTTRTKLQPDGTLSVKMLQSVAATGVGTVSGADYTLTDSQTTRIDGVSSLPFSYHLERNAKLIGSGVADITPLCSPLHSQSGWLRDKPVRQSQR